MRKQYRVFIDIAMTLLLPLLMAYSLIGETFHEIAGTAMLALFILHHIQNRRWFPGLFRSRYSRRRIFQTVLDSLLLVFMIIQPVSGILMSKHLYTFLQIPGAAARVREIHLCLAYWGYILISLHAGTHLSLMVERIQSRGKKVLLPFLCTDILICAYGIYAFFRRQFPDYMFRRTAFVFFDYSSPLIVFILDYLAVMVLFETAGYLLYSCAFRTRKANNSIHRKVM